MKQRTAEDMFRTFEDFLLRTATLRLTFRWVAQSTASHKKMSYSSQGRLQFKSPNKVRMEFDATFQVVCDGVFLAITSGAPEVKTMRAATSMRKNLIVVLARLGALATKSFILEAAMPNYDAKDACRLSRFKYGPKGKGEVNIQYQARYPRSNISHSYLVMFDPQASRLLSHTVSFKSKRVAGSSSEVYQDCELNSEIPDEVFALP